MFKFQENIYFTLKAIIQQIYLFLNYAEVLSFESLPGPADSLSETLKGHNIRVRFAVFTIRLVK